MLERKKVEQWKKAENPNDFRAMLDKAEKIGSKKKGKKIEIGISPDDIVKARKQQQTNPQKEES